MKCIPIGKIVLLLNKEDSFSKCEIFLYLSILGKPSENIKVSSFLFPHAYYCDDAKKSFCNKDRLFLVSNTLLIFTNWSITGNWKDR